MCQWAHDVGLVINVQKTKLMYIQSSHRNSYLMPNILAQDHECLHNNFMCRHDNKRITLETVQEHMYLELIISNRFN